MSRCRILVVDDEPAMREVVQTRLSEWGFQVRTAATVEAARAHIVAFDPHVVISDVVMPDASGMALLEQLDKDHTRTVVMMTAYGTIGTAVQAMKLGATEFLTKPLDYVALHRLLDEVAARIPDVRPTAAALPADTGRIVGTSRAVAELWSAIEAAASSEAPVLIVGESGTGKELVARTIHERGTRRSGPFVPINAAAIPEALAEGELFGYERGAFTGAHEARPGLIEQAHRGTLFLDEITEMTPALQPKLLRVLEDRIVRRVGARVEMESDARFIAATNRQPQQAVTEGRLRHDLRYRLDVLRVDVPPLRERTEDIPALAASFLADCAARYGRPSPGLSAAAIDALVDHAWPGNIRELRNAIERGYASARGDQLAPAHLRLEPGERGHAQAPAKGGAEVDAQQLGIVIPRGVTAAAAERILILETLKATDNNKAEAARRLGMDVKTIRNKLKAFGLSGDEP